MIYLIANPKLITQMINNIYYIAFSSYSLFVSSMLLQSYLKTHGAMYKNNNITNISHHPVNRAQDNPYEWQQRINRNRQLLLMMHKLQQVEESAWGKCLRFEKSQLFLMFQKRFTFKQIFRLRIDDIIYIALLTVICFVFGVLPSNLSQTNIFSSLLVKAYRYMLVFLVLFSCLWLISSNGYRHWVFVMVCVLFPILTMLMYMKILPFDQVDPSITLFHYLHIMSLLIVYIALYVVYPMKQFVRQKIGSLYSYLYALSTLTLFLIWPAYSLIQQFINNNGAITFTFITQNRALIITFLVIIVFTFHLLTHHTFFEGSLLQTKRLLLIQYKLSQLTQALQQVEIEYKQQLGQDGTLAPLNNNNTSTNFNPALLTNKPKPSQLNKFLYRNFTTYSRIMSFIVFSFTAAIQIYVFLYLADNLSYIFRCLGVMVFCVGFLVYGCIINLMPVSRQATLYFFSIVSLVPAAFSPLYCTSFTFYQYIFLATTLPYATIFWCVVRSLSKRRPFLKTNMLVILYIFAHIPLTLFMVNSLQMISTDANTVYIFNIIVLGIVGVVSVVGVGSFIGWLIASIKQLPKQQKQVNRMVNYNYYEQGDPLYIPYTKKQSFSLAWLSSLDIRNLAQIFNCIVFILAELATMFMFNQLDTTSIVLIEQRSRYIIYAQFYISLAYFTYAYSYIVFRYDSNATFVILLLFGVLAIFGIVFSYILQLDIAYSFRVAGAMSAAIAMVGIGLQIVKKNNKEIINFLSGVIVILIWIFLIIPYAIALPIIAIYVPVAKYGLFIYACILATTLLLILLVSILSIVFNVLMNKFEEEKKAKFMTADVETYLKEQGVETEDEVLHILYESYEYRDERYVYFMKKGYPIRLYKDPEDKDSNFKTVVYNTENLASRQSMQQIKDDEKQKDYCWMCLTCICGVDENQTQNKMAQVSNKNMIDQDQMEELVPEEFFKQMFIKVIRNQQHKQRKHVDMSKLYSSKSIILRHLTKKNRHMGQQYAILKTKKNRNLGNQIFHLIFDFLANQDDPPLKIIFNDFLIFCSIIDMPELSKNTLNDIFLDFSTNLWKNNTAIDIDDFSLIIEQLTQKKYPTNPPHQDNKYIFLLESIYPNLCQYSQFQDIVNQRRAKKTKQVNINNINNITPGVEFSENYSTIKSGQLISGFAEKARSTLNVFTMSSQELESSPFVTSFQRHKKINQKLAGKREKLQQKKMANMKDKLIEPAKQQIIQPKAKKQQKKQKQKSCKLIIYEKYQSCKQCCRTIEQQQAVIKRKNVKPWQFLAVESIRIMQHKQSEWKQQKKQKQYEFRIILNNLLIAVFKLADLYTFMQITIMNPQTGWQNLRSFSVLLIQYRIQLYISFCLVLVCAGLGIKGITYIFQDRLGLTQTRIPAMFPHPMFFFTFIYKLLILSFFNTIIMTLFSTFMCNWTTSSTSSYSMILTSTDTPLECFSAQHNIYMICSIIAIILYYPLSAYTMPNFQFAEKRLDLKYKPSYLIIYFQVNFVLAAGKVLLSQITQGNSSAGTIELIFQSINIFCIGLLGLMVIWMKPCLISWFNVIQFLVIWIGFVWNVFGLVLYLTGYWLMCIIASSAISVFSILVSIIYIRRRYYGAVKVEAQANQDQIGQLELAWKYRKQYNVDMVRFQNKRAKGKSREKQSQEFTEKQYQVNVKKDEKKVNNSKDIDEARTNFGSQINFGKASGTHDQFGIASAQYKMICTSSQCKLSNFIK